MPKSNTLNMLGRVISNPKKFAGEWRRTQQDLAQAQNKIAFVEHRLLEANQRLVEADRRLAEAYARITIQAKTTTTKQLKVPTDYPWPDVSKIISEMDGMFDGNSNHYLGVGISAMQNIAFALEAGFIGHISSILDMPCGYGRVTRVLRVSFSAAEISVCDIDADAVAFCAAHFNARPLASSADFARLNFDRTFDLIWVGSLITHLPEPATANFIAFVLRHLSSQGVAVMSSHGAYVAGRIEAGQNYGIERDATLGLLDDYFRTGYGYANYSGVNAVDKYGISTIGRRWLEGKVVTAGGMLVSYRDHAWDRHHDVIAFARNDGKSD